MNTAFTLILKRHLQKNMIERAHPMTCFEYDIAGTFHSTPSQGGLDGARHLLSIDQSHGVASWQSHNITIVGFTLKLQISAQPWRCGKRVLSAIISLIKAVWME